MKGRAERRSILRAIKRRVQGYFNGWPHTPRDVGKVAASPKLCSCAMCGNRRRIDGPTRKEQHND